MQDRKALWIALGLLVLFVGGSLAIVMTLQAPSLAGRASARMPTNTAIARTDDDQPSDLTDLKRAADRQGAEIQSLGQRLARLEETDRLDLARVNDLALRVEQLQRQEALVKPPASPYGLSPSPRAADLTAVRISWSMVSRAMPG